VVFDGVDDMNARVHSPDLQVTEDSVLILRNAGPVGAPGMPEAGALPIPNRLYEAGVRDMVRISDARMSGTSAGTIVLHVAPEAAVGGPLALVVDGDLVELDVVAGRLDLLVDETDLTRRAASAHPLAADPDAARGYRRLYITHVTQANRGCDLDFLTAATAAPASASLAANARLETT
jgi:dihydroxy-acid dehydratase